MMLVEWRVAVNKTANFSHDKKQFKYLLRFYFFLLTWT